MRGGGINGDRQRKSKGMEEEEIKGHAMKADGVDDDDTIDALSEKWGDNPWNIRSGRNSEAAAALALANADADGSFNGGAN
jgi:hypothetical protein